MEPVFGFLSAISLSVLAICLGNFETSRSFKWYEYHSHKFKTERVTAYLRGIDNTSVKEKWQPDFKNKTGMFCFDQWGSFLWFTVAILLNILIIFTSFSYNSSAAYITLILSVASLAICTIDLYFQNRNHKELHDYIVSL